MKMKRKTLRGIALFFAIMMSAAMLLSGCGNSQKEPAASNPSSTQTNSPEGTEGTVVQEKTGKITVMIYDRGNMPSSEGTLNDNRWTRWIRENAPVAEIEFVPVPRAEATQTLSVLFASGEAPDVLPNYEATSLFYQNGNVMEITDEMLDKMPNYKMMLEEYPILKKTATVDGKLVYFTKFSNISPNHTIVIRKDWLDNLGLDMPKTPEDLYNIIYAFTYNDPDRNGKNDTWGINLTTDAQRVLSHMYGFPNPLKYAFDSNGELYYVWDRIESWLGFVKKIVDNKCVNPDFITMKGDDDQADFLNGKIGIYCSGRFTNASRLNLFTSFKNNFPDATLDTFALKHNMVSTLPTQMAVDQMSASSVLSVRMWMPHVHMSTGSMILKSVSI